jgi:hypothetical protein
MAFPERAGTSNDRANKGKREEDDDENRQCPSHCRVRHRGG